MLAVLYVMVRSAKDFQHNDMKMGNMHPESILFGASDRQVRVINRYSWPNEPIGTQKIMDSSRGSYVAPE